MHKTANILNKMPKSLLGKAKGRLQDIWMAETRADAEAAFDFFVEAYCAKYDKATVASSRSGIGCSLSTIFQPNTGSTSAREIR
jgi:hypothetical protein